MSDQARAENLAAGLRNCEGEVTALRAERDRYRETLEEIRERWAYPKLVAVVDEALSEAAKR